MKKTLGPAEDPSFDKYLVVHWWTHICPISGKPPGGKILHHRDGQTLQESSDSYRNESGFGEARRCGWGILGRGQL